MAEGNFSLADVGAMLGNRGDGFFGGGSGGIGLIAILFLFVLFAGGGAWGGNRPNVATQDQVQGAFEYSNLLDQNRDITTAVTNGTAQAVATTNQTFHDMANIVMDKYNEITRDIAAVQVSQAQALANQNACCCDTKMLIQEVNAVTNANIAQSRYDAALANANTNAAIAAGFADLKQTMAQDKITSLNNRIAQLELAQATSSVVRYPTMTTYTSGCNPFCNCGCGCGM